MTRRFVQIVPSRALFALVVGAMFAACRPTLPAPAGAPGTLPSGRPALRGTVTEVIGPRIRLDTDPGASGGVREAVLVLAPQGRVMRRSGEVVSWRELDLDQTVSAWLTSPGERRGDRLHATASALVIE